MAEVRDPASTRIPAAPEPGVDRRLRMPAAFASLLAGAALLVGTAVTVVIVVTATSGG